jgi:hypothetical protein
VGVPLPEYAGRSRSRTLDGGSAVKVVHRLGRGVKH